MMRWRRGQTAMAGGVALLFAAGGCAGAIDQVITAAVSAPSDEVAAMAGAAPMPGDPQTLMTHLAPPDPDDALKGEWLVNELRRHTAPYRDVRQAIADGYRSFPPEPDSTMRVIHFVHRQRSAREQQRTDVRAPGALLYERTDSGLRLVGAMFTAPVSAPLEELNRRVPLSLTQWHLHQNICVPKPVWNERQWRRRAADGRPLFGPGSPTRSEQSCEQAGGRFLPTVFGWMVHIHMNAHDPADIWNAMYGHDAAHGHGHSH